MISSIKSNRKKDGEDKDREREDKEREGEEKEGEGEEKGTEGENMKGQDNTDKQGEEEGVKTRLTVIKEAIETEHRQARHKAD